ncbi:MAG: acetylornithine deacetylase, partial [Ruthenibacterium sp.]
MDQKTREQLKEVLAKNRQSYVDCLLELARHDTHDIGHGIEGGLEANGQEYLAGLAESLHAKSIKR